MIEIRFLRLSGCHISGTELPPDRGILFPDTHANRRDRKSLSMSGTTSSVSSKALVRESQRPACIRLPSMPLRLSTCRSDNDSPYISPSALRMTSDVNSLMSTVGNC